jgi:beta propeller repeat protein
MKSKLFVILSVALTLVLGVFGFVQADFSTIQVTINSYEDRFPDIKESYLVWETHMGGDSEIFLYNIVSKEKVQITNNNYDDISPKTDGTYVVWQGFESGEWDIFLWDGNETHTISNRGAADLFPQIANGLVVWTSQPLGDDSLGRGEIILYDAGTQTSTELSEEVDAGNTLDDSAPRINNEEVMWVQTDNDGHYTTYLYPLPNGPCLQAPEDYIWKDSPQTDGSLMVSSPYDGHDKEIVLYNTGLGSHEQFTDNDISDTHPRISGNYVAWVGGEGKASEIYLASYEPGDTGTVFDTGTDVTTGDSNGDGGLCFVSTVANSLRW